MLGPPRNSAFVTRSKLIEEALTRSVIGAFFEVYNNLGFGFLEHLYVLALERELIARGHHVSREVWVHVRYKGEDLGIQRIDMIVDLEVGLLLHFGTKASIHREICHNTRSNQPNPFNPPNPLNLPS
jgi:hypothetical protein